MVSTRKRQAGSGAELSVQGAAIAKKVQSREGSVRRRTTAATTGEPCVPQQQQPQQQQQQLPAKAPTRSARPGAQSKSPKAGQVTEQHLKKPGRLHGKQQQQQQDEHPLDLLPADVLSILAAQPQHVVDRQRATQSQQAALQQPAVVSRKRKRTVHEVRKGPVRVAVLTAPPAPAGSHSDSRGVALRFALLGGQRLQRSTCMLVPPPRVVL